MKLFDILQKHHDEIKAVYLQDRRGQISKDICETRTREAIERALDAFADSPLAQMLTRDEVHAAMKAAACQAVLDAEQEYMACH